MLIKLVNKNYSKLSSFSKVDKKTVTVITVPSYSFESSENMKDKSKTLRSRINKKLSSKVNKKELSILILQSK